MWLLDGQEYYAPPGVKWLTYQNTVRQYIDTLSQQVGRGERLWRDSGGAKELGTVARQRAGLAQPRVQLESVTCHGWQAAQPSQLAGCPVRSDPAWSQLYPESGMPLFYRQIVGMSYQLALFRWAPAAANLLG